MDSEPPCGRLPVWPSAAAAKAPAFRAVPSSAARDPAARHTERIGAVPVGRNPTKIERSAYGAAPLPVPFCAPTTGLLITYEPHLGSTATRVADYPPGSAGFQPRGKLAKAPLRAPSASKDARAPRKTADLSSPRDRDELGT